MIEGHRQGVPRQLRLTAEGLEPSNGFSARAGVLGSLACIRAQAGVAGDRLNAPDGRPLPAPFALAIRPLPGEGAARMLLTLSLPDGPNAEPTAELLIPRGVFDTLLRDWRDGLAGRLELSGATDLWAPAGDADLPRERPLDWRLGPAQQPGQAAEAKGIVEALSWIPTALEAAPAHVPDEEGEPDETTEALGRIGASLRIGLILLVFLVFVIALK